MIIYHGSECIVEKPDLHHSRSKIDFGRGFYLTEDIKMAERWAAGKGIDSCYTNIYELHTKDLSVIQLGLSKQWLDFIVANRKQKKNPFRLSGIDIIVGPVADDKMFTTINRYMSGDYTAEQTIRYLNPLGYQNQIVLKTDKALQNLAFLDSKKIHGQQKQRLQELSERGRILMERKLADLIRKDGLQKSEFLQMRGELTSEGNDYEDR